MTTSTDTTLIEIANWSAHVLNWLVKEEDCSPEFRQLARSELQRRACAGTATLPLEPETVTLTTKMLHDAGSYQGHGWTRPQLAILGVPWPPRAGWLKAMHGKVVPLETWERFVASKGLKRNGNRTKISQLEDEPSTTFDQR